MSPAPRARWFICRRCGLLQSTPDPHFNLFAHRCEACEHGVRWLSDEELAALRSNPAMMDAAVGRYVNMQKDGDGYTFTEWGDRPPAGGKRTRGLGRR
ncbi:MAG TPA: hypothetical protein VNN07_02490 [Candidatus Tectomicrobia bacterium]|nr:hypothetical protein [Candidatus Tectomicrobia bacterium]